MRSWHPYVLAVSSMTLAMLAASCQDQRQSSPTAVNAGAVLSQTGVEISGNRHFTFLQPLSEPRSAGAAFDGSLSPVVSISSGGSVVASFDSDGRGPERVRPDSREEHYIVNWQVPRDLSAGSYRISVKVGDLLLGFHDAEVSSARSAAGALVPGRTVPIKFRIEQGALNIALVPVDASGGSVTATDGGAELDIPAGALASETPITVEELTSVADPDGRLIGGTAYEFGPDGTQFAEPVQITLSYDPAALPAGTSERLLRLHTLVNGRWEQVPGSSVDAASATVTGAVTHFSTYALLPESFAQVAAGEFHACGLTESGAAWCWGSNQFEQLGGPAADSCTPEFAAGAIDCSTVAVEVQGGFTFQSIESGRQHTCGVTTAGEVYCWGSNGFGQLGDGTLTASAVPVRVANPATFASVSAEFQQTCGLTTTGEVYCWGRNATGQLGSTTPDCTVGSSLVPCSSTPVRVSIPPIEEVDVGLSHVCAVSTSGDIYCWGWNVFGQLGIGTVTVSEAPTLVGGPYSSVSAGAVNTCAIDTSGSGFCWGANFQTGALGDGTAADSPVPTAVAGGLNFVEMDASNGNYIFTHSCGITTANEAYCWGANRDGALGVGTAPSTCTLRNFAPYDCALTPVAVSGGLQLANLTTGRGFTCAFELSGDLYCWGLNDAAQLGNGTTVAARTPVKVATSAP